MTGTPITFQRFTKRSHGWVGGYPQTNLFRARSPYLAPGLWMVGDSIFPGQSLAAVSMGGMRVGREISNEMSDQIVVAKHNIDQHPNQPSKWGIRGIPTMLLFKDGELKATKVGATTKSNIISWIKENI